MPAPAQSSFRLNSIGIIRKGRKGAVISLSKGIRPALLGLGEFSHVWVLYWFHENDTTPSRSILQVHPRKNPENPLTGVFGTRSPMRPNLIGLCLCRIMSVNDKEGWITVSGIDARDGTPLLDIKPYLPDSDRADDIKVPTWVEGVMADSTRDGRTRYPSD